MTEENTEHVRCMDGRLLIGKSSIAVPEREPEPKRPVGRPPKYSTDEERKQARKCQFKIYRKKIYETEKQIRNESCEEQREIMKYLRKNNIEEHVAKAILAMLT
jgi:hypothetical protein